MLRLVTFLSLAAVTLAVVAANAASQEQTKPAASDPPRSNDTAGPRFPTLDLVLPFHAPFSLN